MYMYRRSTLLQVLVAKLKTELDKKEKQMDFLKQLAEEMHSRLEANPSPLVTSTPVPAPIPIPLPSPGLIETSTKEQIGPSLADLEEQYASLQKSFETQRKQLEATRNRVLTSVILGGSCNNFIRVLLLKTGKELQGSTERTNIAR